MLPWHQNEEFWKAFGPMMFTSERWQEAVSDVDNLIPLLKLKKDEQILDLCCGPGRHTLELARRGFQVTGVDRNNQYLRKAKRLAKIEKYSCAFHSADMREYRRPETFDAAMNLFTSIGYFDDPEDDRRVLKNLYDSLKPGGRLLIDTQGREIIARIFTERDWQEKSGVFYLEERHPVDDWARIRVRWIRLEATGQKQEFLTHLRLFTGAQLREWLLETGFRSVQIFGDLKGAPYDQNAKRLVAVAVK